MVDIKNVKVGGASDAIYVGAVTDDTQTLCKAEVRGQHPLTLKEAFGPVSY